MHRDESKDLHRAVWLWAIPLPLLIHLGARQLDARGEFFARWIESEAGIIENGTVLFLIPAAIFALVVAKRLYRLNVFYPLWFIIVALTCAGFAGEEVSWGQHWIGWDSPDYFAEHNRQGETNIHNLNIHFGRVVKSILTLAIVIGGLVLPFRYGTKKSGGDAQAGFWAVVTPTRVCIPAAAFVLGVRVIERFKTWFDLEWSLLAVNLKENQELYIALFLLIYAWSAFVRSRTVG